MKWETVIGLEVHVELSTETKMFCSCPAIFGAEPNTLCCPVCMGMPGALPTINAKAVEYAAMAGLALNCAVSPYSRFDRKNYFYPDLPKAYQISQLYHPLCTNGFIEIDVNGNKKKIRIKEIHMEEDAGKLFHSDSGETKIDFNRCGIPLIEIVSEADLSDEEEVTAYLEKLKLTLEYLGVSTCRMQEGALRADINLSVKKKDETELGVRTEMKNMNSFREIRRAVKSESERQISVLENGGVIVQETRRWDEEKGVSVSMRNKENVHDYRYFPEPDLPPIVLESEWIDLVKNKIPALAHERVLKYVELFGVSHADAKIITSQRALADFFENVCTRCENVKMASNLIVTEVVRLLKDDGIQASDMKLSAEKFAQIINLADRGDINVGTAKKIIAVAFSQNIDVPDYIKSNSLEQINDELVILPVAKDVVESNPKSLSDYMSGKKKAYGFLVGQIMEQFGFKANPTKVNECLMKILDEKSGGN
ncbi:MAG: Asp-tRNA(Asn)/Glu-tRNA(Gln) amidotransferase subunit GatB [Clostridia bacterium]|nr:Asp-tRNA(Asn)/Glu-tRNA(Gln) amidotransferase subunit GatB [Clostridia bacterium]